MVYITPVGGKILVKVVLVCVKSSACNTKRHRSLFLNMKKSTATRRRKHTAQVGSSSNQQRPKPIDLPIEIKQRIISYVISISGASALNLLASCKAFCPLVMEGIWRKKCLLLKRVTTLHERQRGYRSTSEVMEWVKSVPRKEEKDGGVGEGQGGSAAKNANDAILGSCKKVLNLEKGERLVMSLVARESLGSIDVRRSGISTYELVKLTEVLPNIRTLAMGDLLEPKRRSDRNSKQPSKGFSIPVPESQSFSLDTALSTIFEQCKNINTIHLHETNGEGWIRSLVGAFAIHSIRVLILEGTNFDDDEHFAILQAIRSTLQVLRLQYPVLRYGNLEGTIMTVGDNLATAITSCPVLHTLEIATDYDQIQRTAGWTLSSIENLPKSSSIESLSLSRIAFTVKDPNRRDLHVGFVFHEKRFPNLKHVNLRDYCDMNEKGHNDSGIIIEPLGSNYGGQLVSLVLQVFHVRLETLVKLVEKCPLLERFEVDWDWVTDQELGGVDICAGWRGSNTDRISPLPVYQALSENLRFLEVGNHQVKEEDWLAVASRFKKIERCRLNQSIFFSSEEIMERVQRMEERRMAELEELEEEERGEK